MARTPTPTSLPPLPSEHPDDFDLFADVSHHGSSLFEFLTLDPAFPSSSPPPPPFNTEFSHPAISDTTPTPSEHPRSASTSHTAPHLPAQPTENLQPTVESYCTADPSENHPIDPVTTPSFTSPVSAHLIASSQQKNPPPPAGRRPRKQATKSTSLPNSAVKQKASAARKPSIPPAKPIGKARSPNTPTSSTARRKRGPTKQIPKDVPSASVDGLGISEGSEQSEEIRKPISKQQSPQSAAAGGEASSLADDGQGKDTHNSHTRRCRAKVNSKFQELLSILPTPPSKTGIKHKAQILDYAIRVFRDIHARKMLLEAELALSSRAQLNAWIENVVTRSVTLQDALAPYLSLMCTKGGWKYSEAWVPTQEVRQEAGPANGVSGESRVLTPNTLPVGPSSRLRLGLAVIPSLGNTDDPDLQAKLERFRDRSRSYTCKARVDLPGRVMCTTRPEWLPSLEDQEAFQRSRLARAATLVVCFGVPIFIRGHIAAVAVFFDTEQRAYDAKCVDLADNVAGMLGNAYGASTFRRRGM